MNETTKTIISHSQLEDRAAALEVGMKIRFGKLGSPRQTLAVVVELDESHARIKLLEKRGVAMRRSWLNRSSGLGQNKIGGVWRIRRWFCVPAE